MTSRKSDRSPKPSSYPAPPSKPLASNSSPPSAPMPPKRPVAPTRPMPPSPASMASRNKKPNRPPAPPQPPEAANSATASPLPPGTSPPPPSPPNAVPLPPTAANVQQDPPFGSLPPAASPLPPAAQPVPAAIQPPPSTPGSSTPVGLSPGSTLGAGAAHARPVPVSSEAKSSQPSRPVVPDRTPRATPAAKPVATPGTTARPIPVAAPDGDQPRVRDADDEQDSQVAEKAIRSAPPWLISAVIHMVALILAGIFYLANDGDKQIFLEIRPAPEEGEQLDDAMLEMPQLETLEVVEPMFSEDITLVEDPLAAPPELDLTIDATQAISEIAAPSIGMALNGRTAGAKKALLAAYGGNATTEAAVELGLEWLARQQDKRTGMWSLKGPYVDGGGAENEVAATALALLAFQGAGNTHQAGKHKRVVERGADALLKLQDADGNFFHEGVYNHRLYTQAQATIAVCELYGMTKDKKFRLPAQKALDYAARAQSPTLGGWRYTPRQDSDTSVTGWFVMALQSGMMSGLEVQSPTLDAVSKYLDRATKDGSQYSYQAGGEPTLTMTAEGLLCRQYLGWDHDDPRLQAGIDYVNENLIDYSNENVYYWYYATQATHHMGGEDWNKWNEVMRTKVPARQVKEGAERGSWNPGGDRWGHHGGRLYTTCLSLFMLEVYYRHLPIYKH